MKTFFKLMGLCLLVAVTSCSAPKNVVYMQDLTPETPVATPAVVQYLRVKPQDKLYINVHCRDENISSLFNVRGHGYYGGGYGYGGGSSLDLYTYNVDEMGNIEFPVVGMVHVAGLTRQEVADEIRKILIEQNLVKDPYVSCSFSTAYFYTIGESGKKGQTQIPKDAFTIIEAIALAGDLPLTGSRTNIQVIREIAGKLHTYEIDLTSAESIVHSPAYYIQPKDIIYVVPTKKQQYSSSAVGSSVLTPSFWMSTISSIISLSLTIYALVK